MTTATDLAADDRELLPLALSCLSGVGPVTIRRLLHEHHSLADAFAAAAPDEATRERAISTARRVRARCAERGIILLAPGDARYPVALLDLEDPPAVLYAMGRLDLVERPAVAMVGARRATSYGLQIASSFARQLARAGVTVVSGLALGIDATAHAATLEANGATIAVQGTGVDVPYPRANTALHARIAREGLVLSELPPGRTAHAGAFPRRNRLIAALADVVVVVEAGTKSGSLITAQLGVALGRMVAAVPGPIDRESSMGANLLLRDGAQTVTSVDDVLGLLALTPRGRAGVATLRATHHDEQVPLELSESSKLPEPPDLPPTPFAPGSPESRVFEVLSFGPQGPDELVRACAIAPRDIGIAIANLVLTDAIRVDSSGLAHVRRAGRPPQPA